MNEKLGTVSISVNGDLCSYTLLSQLQKYMRDAK